MQLGMSVGISKPTRSTVNLRWIVLNIDGCRRVTAHEAFKIAVVYAGGFFIQKNVPLRGLSQVAGLAKGLIIITGAAGVLRSTDAVHETIH